MDAVKGVVIAHEAVHTRGEPGEMDFHDGWVCARGDRTLGPHCDTMDEDLLVASQADGSVVLARAQGDSHAFKGLAHVALGRLPVFPAHSAHI